MRDRLTPANLQALRDARTRPTRDTSIAADMQSIADQLKRQARTVAGASDAWIALVPLELRERTTIVGVTKGVLTIRASDAATRFALDRWLRAGGESALLRHAPTTLTAIRLT